MKKSILLIAVVCLFASCTQRGCQSMSRDFQTSERTYEITVYSGGKTIYADKFKGILNQEDHSDGMYYFKGDTLIEIGGQYTIKSVK